MARSLVDNAADPEQVEQAVRADKRRAKTFRQALATIASTSEGEILFEELTERAAFFRSSFDSDAMAMAFAEGRRSFGLALLDDWLAARPDAFASLLTRRALAEQAE